MTRAPLRATLLLALAAACAAPGDPRDAAVAPAGAARAAASANTAVTWSIQEGASGGAVSSGGLYTAPAAAGTYHVVAASVADASRYGMAAVAVTAAPALAVTTTALPGGTAGKAYAASLAAAGGTPPYTWSVTAGALPAGLLLAAGGSLSGTPTAAGTASFTVRVADSAGHAATAGLSLAVVAAGAIDQSILPAEFRTQWDPGIPGGIPADDDPVRPATVWLPAGNPYGGYSVNPALAGTANAAAFTAALQAAVTSAGAAATPQSRKIVLIKAGTYYVAPQSLWGNQVGIYVQVDNVTIRGEGPDSTRLAATGTIHNYGTVVLFGHRSGSSDADFAVQAVTADALRGATTVQVANAGAYVVGDVVTIDMLDGAASAVGPAYFNAGYVWFWDAQYFKRTPAFSWTGPSTGAAAFPGVTDLASANAAAQGVVPKWRSTMQEDEIVAISGNTLTLRDPLVIDFRLSASPQVWRTVPRDTATLPVGNRWDGLESIAVAGGNNEWGFPGGCVAFSYMAYSWAKNVEADGEQWSGDPAHPGKYGYNIGVGRSYRVVVRDSYAHGSADINPGGQAYGIVLGVGSSACLVENNISVYNNKPVNFVSDGGGNVVAYNYVDRAIMWNSPQWQENAIDDCHGSFTHHDLIEGNWTPNLGGDTTHGNSGWHTHLRNYASGRNSDGGVTANLRAVGMDGWTHSYAFVGNVLHSGGTVYQITPSSPSGNPVVYQLGNFYGGQSGNWDNGYSASHVYRDGNWDDVTAGVVWASGVRTIPASFYLTARPAFFGANPWPWVDPTTGTAGTLPAKARYDAGTPNKVP